MAPVPSFRKGTILEALSLAAMDSNGKDGPSVPGKDRTPHEVGLPANAAVECLADGFGSRPAREVYHQGAVDGNLSHAGLSPQGCWYSRLS